MLTDEQRAYQRAWYAKNIEKRRETSREAMKRWRKENPTLARAAVKRWRDKNPETIREGNRRRSYGLSPDQFSKLFDDQGKACAICRGQATNEKNWHIDHCHSTKRVRGILCNHCNLMLGHAKDRQDVLGSAIKYLMAAE